MINSIWSQWDIQSLSSFWLLKRRSFSRKWGTPLASTKIDRKRDFFWLVLVMKSETELRTEKGLGSLNRRSKVASDSSKNPVKNAGESRGLDETSKRKVSLVSYSRSLFPLRSRSRFVKWNRAHEFPKWISLVMIALRSKYNIIQASPRVNRQSFPAWWPGSFDNSHDLLSTHSRGLMNMKFYQVACVLLLHLLDFCFFNLFCMTNLSWS